MAAPAPPGPGALPAEAPMGVLNFHLRRLVYETCVSGPFLHHTDDEFRKHGDLMGDVPVVTVQESVQGHSHSLSFDLMKKYCSADPIAMRLPYATVTGTKPLVGWKRFECNSLPEFGGIPESTSNSLMRRVLRR